MNILSLNDRSLLAAAVLIAAASAATAQTPIYRCGTDGKSFQSEPCANGRAVDLLEPPSAEQAAQAHAVARDERRLADRMERERAARERSIKPALATGFDARPQPTVAKSVLKARAHDGGKSKHHRHHNDNADEDFVAFVPAPRR